MFVGKASEQNPTTNLVYTVSLADKPQFTTILDPMDLKMKSALAFVDSKGETLREWDFLEHMTSTTELLKIHYHLNGVRSTKGVKDLQFCFDYSRSSSGDLNIGYMDFAALNDVLTQQVNFVAGKPVEGGCPTEGAKISTKRVSTVSDAAKKKYLDPHSECNRERNPDKWGEETPETKECVKALHDGTMATQFTSNVTVENAPTVVKTMAFVHNLFKAAYFFHYTPIFGENTEEGFYNAEAELSTTKPVTVDMIVHLPYETIKIQDAPVTHTTPHDNVRYYTTLLDIFENYIGFCVLTPRDYDTFDGKHELHSFSDKWTLAAGNKGIAVFVKKETDSSMAVKIVHATEVVEIDSKGLTLNGKHIADSELENVVAHHSVDGQYIFRLWKMGNDRLLDFELLGYVVRRASHAITVESFISNRGNNFGMCGNQNENPEDDDSTVYTL